MFPHGRLAYNMDLMVERKHVFETAANRILIWPQSVEGPPS